MLSTWLYRIALNECLTFLNKQRAVQTVSIDEEDSIAVQKLESDPYFSGDRAQLLLQKALCSLPEKQRMVFNLKYYQEMKYEEMSQIFGTSVGALKASYHHGGIILKQLRKLGASCDWERTAFTMDEERSESVIKVFVDLYNKGLIYRGVRMLMYLSNASAIT